MAENRGHLAGFSLNNYNYFNTTAKILSFISLTCGINNLEVAVDRFLELE